MTYKARGRSIIEVVVVSLRVSFVLGIVWFISDNIYCVFQQAVLFVTFLVGFITVLCIGNYLRAMRAQERQKQRRDAKLVASQVSGAYAADHGGSYEAPVHSPVDPGVI